jgi:FkbM family methyltransferase
MRSLLVTPILLPALRWWTRLLRVDRRRVGAIERCARAALHAPVMAAFVAIIRARRAILGPLRVVVGTSRGLQIECDLSDLIQMYIAVFDVWEPDLTAFIHERLRDGDLFIDVGANVGWLSLVAAQRSGDRGLVVALEPAAQIYEAFVANIKRNHMQSRIRAVPAAATDERGEARLHAGPAWNIGLTSTVPRRGLHPGATAPAASLGDLLQVDEIERARIIKIDVEGGEDRVLLGMLPLLPRLRDDVEILVELSPAWWTDRRRTPAEVLQPFVSAGFRVYAIENSYWPWRYLWPNDVRPARRIRESIDRRTKRADIVLSRVDAEELAFSSHD